MKRQIDFSRLVFWLDIWTLLSSIAAAFYLMFFSVARLFFQIALEFCKIHGFILLLAIILLVGLFILTVTGMIFPIAVRMDSRKESVPAKELYPAFGMAFGPWIDLANYFFSGRFSLASVDRIAILILGTGSLAILMAAVSGRAPSRRGAWFIALIILAIFVIFYSGLWKTGGMGNIVSATIWHLVMVYSGFSAFQEWYYFMLTRSR